MQAVTINEQNLATVDWDENYFKFCQFENFSIEGGLVYSDFVDCSFSDLDWYWGLFTGSNFVKCSFTRCVFRGTSFADTKFVECSFVECRFMKDNLGGDCDFSETVAYACVVEGGEGFLAEKR
jgi:uncharacterized protein YjbI with pentapeptide repeats